MRRAGKLNVIAPVAEPPNAAPTHYPAIAASAGDLGQQRQARPGTHLVGPHVPRQSGCAVLPRQKRVQAYF